MSQQLTTLRVMSDEFFQNSFSEYENSTIYITIFRANIWRNQIFWLLLQPDIIHMYNHVNINNKKQKVNRN